MLAQFDWMPLKMKSCALQNQPYLGLACFPKPHLQLFFFKISSFSASETLSVLSSLPGIIFPLVP
jgi:hypothetical protein